MTAARETYVFELPWNVKSDKIIAGLSGKFSTTAPAPHRDRVKYFDTFDWRLYRRGLSLVSTGSDYELRKVEDAVTLESTPAAGDLRFWWDFPTGGFRNRLRGILKERALIEVGELGLRSKRLRVLNADDKTVARVEIQVGEAFCNGRTAARVRSLGIIPLRGYTKEARQLARHFTKTGLRPARRNSFAVAVVACGREPGDYTSKLSLNLNSSMTGLHAAGVIFEHLLDTMQRNLDGIRNDIDTEFLHDFRVAIRRTRSGLSQLKLALPNETTRRFAEGFAELGRGTNRLRDLDVYLLSRKRYQDMLTEDLRPGLEPLFDKLARERTTHWKSLVQLIGSSEYRELVGEWRKTLRTFADQGDGNNRTAITVNGLASKVIKKRYNRVIRFGKLIDDDTPDTALHSLRIDCKKLRYMLEFFASLYPPKTVGGFIGQLKQLQDNLGDFNDFSVQQDELKSFLRDMGEEAAVDTAAAIGVLIAKLEHRQHEVRRQFAAAFESFAGTENEKRFKKLFAKGE